MPSSSSMLDRASLYGGYSPRSLALLLELNAYSRPIEHAVTGPSGSSPHKMESRILCQRDENSVCESVR